MYTVSQNKLILNPHWGQHLALSSPARITAVIAGTQSGKTITGPHWLMQEMINCGPGDYLVATPTYPLLNLKLLPEFLRIFYDILALGKYHVQSRIFTLSPFGQKKLFGDSGVQYASSIFFGHASDPESLESATAKAAWLDEAGQRKFKLGSYEAVLRRLAVNLGRLLITTTPYFIGWLKSLIYDNSHLSHINCINFKSIMNPTFPKSEYLRAKAEMALWKFQMFYDGLFTRPAGAIYDCFDEKIHTTPRFDIPSEWTSRYLGLDFGGVNTAAVYIATDPNTNINYVYRTYKAGSKSSQEHAKDILKSEPITPLAMGGAPSEDQWRREFSKHPKLKVYNPRMPSVELRIDRTYALFKSQKLIIFDDLDDLLTDIRTYSRKLDDEDNPTHLIEDKEKFHLADALGYIAGGKLYLDALPHEKSSINLNQ